MNWIIDAAMVVIVLVFLFIGIAKGGVNTILSFASGIVILLVCFFLTGPVGNAVNKGDIDEKTAVSIESSLNLDNGKAKLAYNDEDPKQLVFTNNEGEESLLSTYLQSKPAFNKLTASIERIASDTLNNNGEITIGFVIALIIAQLAIKVGVFIILFLAFKLIFAILKKLWKKAREKGVVVKKVDRVFGAILGIVLAYVAISLVFAVMSFLFDFGLFAGFSDQINSTFIAKFLMDKNLFNVLISNLWIK